MQLTDPVAATKARVKTPIPESADIAVIGAGLGGLMTAAHLSQRGHKVAVFDGHYVAGGCATMFARHTRRGTYRFDIGLHYVGDCGPGGSVPRMLDELGIGVDWIPMDPDGFDTVVLPDRRFPIPSNRELYRDRLVEMFPRETRGIDRYVRLLEEVDTISTWMEAKRFTGERPTRLGFLWTVASRGRMLPFQQNATIGDFLDECTRNPVLRTILLAQTGDYGVPPSRASAMLHCGLANHYFKGAFYPRGGGQIIADKLAALIEANGGTVHLRRPIDRILVEGGRAVGVRVAPQRQDPVELRARAVVSNADLRVTFDELLTDGDVPQDWRGKSSQLEMAGAIFLTCLGVKGGLEERGLGPRNLWCFEDTDIEGLYSKALGGDLTPRCAYITSGSLKDPDTHGHAPEGEQTLEIMTLVPGAARHWGVDAGDIEKGRYRRNPEYLKRKQQVEDGLIAFADRILPGIAADIEFRESATPITHTRYTRAAEGTGYGIAATPGQFMDKRPGARTSLPGLYLAGANTRSGHGIVGAMSSGRVCARKVERDLSRSID
jgi:phytoene dehydrogenase-like protein